MRQRISNPDIYQDSDIRRYMIQPETANWNGYTQTAVINWTNVPFLLSAPMSPPTLQHGMTLLQ